MNTQSRWSYLPSAPSSRWSEQASPRTAFSALTCGYCPSCCSAAQLVLMRRVDFRPAAAGRRAGETEYFDEVVKYGVIATVFLGRGRLSRRRRRCPSACLSRPQRGAWFNFGRVRPLHTSASIFAFGGNALIALPSIVVQRTSRARLFGGDLGWFCLWGYQLFIVLAATGYLLGITQSREYAGTGMVLDSLADDRMGRLSGRLPRHDLMRKEPHIYVANWFYLAFIVTIAMLHIVNTWRCRYRSWVPRAIRPSPASRTR